MNLKVLTFKKLSDLYECIDSLDSSISILEVGQFQSGFHTLLLSNPESINIIGLHATENLNIDQLDATVLKAYFKQLSFDSIKNLFVVESQSLGQLFLFAKKMTDSTDFQIYEIHRAPLPGGYASAFFVNGKETDIPTSLLPNVTARYFPKPSQHLLSLLHFSN